MATSQNYIPKSSICQDERSPDPLNSNRLTTQFIPNGICLHFRQLLSALGQPLFELDSLKKLNILYTNFIKQKINYFLK